jgi:hypothetical protein
MTTWSLPALSSNVVSISRRWARRTLLLSAAAVALSACQSALEQSYQPTVAPSSNPQIVDEVQKNDPRAAMGAREHPRIVASYGGEYKDAKTERLVARIAGALTAVSENPSQSYRTGDQCLCAAGRISLRHAWSSRPCQRCIGSRSRVIP